MSKKHKQRRCRICKKRPVWIGGDVKNSQGTCKKCYHAHVWPERQGAAVKKCQRAILRNRTMTPSGAHLCSLLKRGESLTHGPLRELGDTVQVQLVHDALAMALDRFHADMQHSGDLFRALAFSKELQDRALPREPQVPRLVRRCARCFL